MIKVNVLAPTVCFKIDVFHEIRNYASFLLLQFVPKLFSRGNMSKINVLSPIVYSKLIISRDQGGCHFSTPTVCTKLVQSKYLGKIKVLAPTVWFKIDSFTTSGSMPLFYSYSLYQTCSVEVFGVK